MIHIYCGEGKGKTTAAVGLAVRAAGSGMRVHIIQFLKGGETSELKVLSMLENVTVKRCDREYGFVFSLSRQERTELKKCHDELLSEGLELVQSGKTDMLILDEFNCAVDFGLIDTALADKAVFENPEAAELVLTGRNPPREYIEKADYVSEITEIKHPYQNKGISARKGIEF